MLERARATRGPALMGICNVTPDSFSDGGLHLAPDAARAHVDDLLAQGADVIDVGGESTRPGALPVPPADQIARVLGVVAYAVSRGACVSVDTASAEVAAACLDAGASAINDVSCLRASALAEVVASRGSRPRADARACGTQQDMAGFSRYPDGGYGDVVHEVTGEWEGAAARACSLGVRREALVMDPGLGFAKNARHSAELLARLGEIVRAVGVPVCVGASRKSFLTAVDAGAPPGERLGASIAAALHAARAGAVAFRSASTTSGPTRQAIDLDRSLTARSFPSSLVERPPPIPSGIPAGAASFDQCTRGSFTSSRVARCPSW